MTVKASRLLIGQLAKAAGVRPDSIRFYERTGLLPRPERLSSGYRTYDEVALRRVRFIKRAQGLGFSLGEIGRILRIRDQGGPACPCVLQIAETTLAETEHQLRRLEEFAGRLRRDLRRWKKMTGADSQVASEFCVLIESSKPGGP